MEQTRRFTKIALASALVLCAAAPALADEWNKRTIMTTDQPILVTHTELPAGTYVLKLLNSNTDRHIVQIFNKNETHLYTTILAVNNYRQEPTSDTKFTFWETPSGSPAALRAWFYPGDLYGQEFPYPKEMVAKYTSMNTGAAASTSAEVNNSASMSSTTTTTDTDATAANAPVTEPTSTPTPVTEPVTPVTPPETVEQTPQQPTTPEQTTPVQPPVASTPDTSDADRSAELPTTATNYPLLALAGLASLFTFAALSLFGKKA